MHILLLFVSGTLFSCSYSFTYVKDRHISECSAVEIVEEASEFFNRQDYAPAAHLGSYVSEYFPDSPELEGALYIAGESSFQMEDYWDSFNHFKKLLARFPASRYISVVAERNFEIGEAYLNRKPGFFGHLFTSRGRGVQVMNHLITRFPRSELADDAQMAIADYYFDTEEYVDAAYAYSLLIKEYPRSEWAAKAVYMLGLSFLNVSHGQSYDRESLLKTVAAMEKYMEQNPSGSYYEEAEQVRNESRQSLAAKELELAQFYLKQDRYYGGRLHLANTVLLFPETPAGKTAQNLLDIYGWDTSIHSWDRFVPRDVLQE